MMSDMQFFTVDKKIPKLKLFKKLVSEWKYKRWQNRNFHFKTLSASCHNCFSTCGKNNEDTASDIAMPTTIYESIFKDIHSYLLEFLNIFLGFFNQLFIGS